MDRLKQCEEEVEEAVQTAFAQLKQQARDVPNPIAACACKQWLCYDPCIIGMMPTSIPDARSNLCTHDVKSLLKSSTWLWS